MKKESCRAITNSAASFIKILFYIYTMHEG